MEILRLHLKLMAKMITMLKFRNFEGKLQIKLFAATSNMVSLNTHFNSEMHVFSNLLPSRYSLATESVQPYSQKHASLLCILRIGDQ